MADKKTDWVKMKPAEIEKLIVDIHKEGKSPAEIGLILRDKHGIPKAKLVTKKITKILIDSKLTPKSEKDLLQKNLVDLEKHIGQHKHDYTAKRSFAKKIWAVRKLK